MTKLRFRLEQAIKEYISAFEDKHEVEMEFPVSDDITGIICFGDTRYFNISDIIFDIDNNLPQGLILQWNDDTSDHNLMKDSPEYINLKSYAAGLRYEDLNKEKK